MKDFDEFVGMLAGVLIVAVVIAIILILAGN